MKEAIIFSERWQEWLVIRDPSEGYHSRYVDGRYKTYKEACDAVNAIVKTRLKA